MMYLASATKVPVVRLFKFDNMENINPLGLQRRLMVDTHVGLGYLHDFDTEDGIATSVFNCGSDISCFRNTKAINWFFWVRCRWVLAGTVQIQTI